MDFIEDYVTYHSAYEIPRNYVYFSAINLISSVMHRKLNFRHGDIEIPTNLYTLLVGPQGNGKSTPCRFAKKMFQLVCPELEIGASTQTAEDIVINMSRDDFAKSITLPDGSSVEVRPLAFFINEFKDFIAYAPVRMLNFLGNIYDENPFRASTVKRGLENIINPCVTLLACENPDQLSKFMKNDIFTGGLSRRFILVNEPTYCADAKPFIEIDEKGPIRAAWERVKQRLIDSRKIVGTFKWADTGRKFYGPWYIAKQKSLSTITNPLMCGYVSTKHVQLFKICMLLDAVSDKPMLVFTDDLLELGLSFLNLIEKNMSKLSATSGRNEMAQSYQRALEMIEACGGMIPEKLLKKQLETELSPTETFHALRHLEDTDQFIKKLIAVPNSEGIKVERWMLITPRRWKKGVEEKEFKL